jgi:EAL domain-containing protein (putative c-di-GMP-specific phosphodiesterase class I)
MPSYLKLGADYTRSLNQDNVDNLVDFLLSYCRYKGCTLVLQGVETATELQYWQRKGVETFQGAACT